MGFENRAEQKARIPRKTVGDFDVLPGNFRIEPSQPTLRTKRRMKGCLMPDTEPIEHTTVSFGFDVEVTDSFCGYLRLLHPDVALRTLAFVHCIQSRHSLMSVGATTPTPRRTAKWIH